MNIAIVGTGYVGLTSGACFSELGNNVQCVDIDRAKIENLKKGIMPIYEPGLQELVLKNYKHGRLDFTINLPEALNKSDVVMIAVGTPSLPDGDVDLSYVRDVAVEIGRYLTSYKIIVNKSTVPVGTADFVKQLIRDQLSDPNIEFDVASVPEFLREGSAIKDIFEAERIVIGTESKRARDILVELHSPLHTPIQNTDIRTAELIKYAANAFLAMKISFINEIANIADKVGADVEEVSNGIGTDTRIGGKFLKAGIGFGGACFPKDTKGLIKIAENAGHSFSLIKEVLQINEFQYLKVIEKLNYALPVLKNKTIAILGLAFKPNTDDMRDAPSISIIRDLYFKEPALNIRAYDPIAKEAAQKVIKEPVQYFDSISETIQGADAAIIVTEWKDIVEFGLPNYKQMLNHPIIIDGRNCFNLEEASKSGINYYSIGRKSVIDNKVHI